MRTAPWRRVWVHWLWARDLSREHIAVVLDVPLAEIEGELSSPFHQPAGDAWPFTEPNIAAARRRRILGDTANKIRRLAALLYQPPRIAELLLLKPASVASFVRRTRRLSGRRNDRRVPGELIRPRSESEERAARLAAERARRRRERRERKRPPPGWSYADRSAASRAEAAGLARLQEAVRDGRLSAGELLDLAGMYFAPPRGPAPPPPKPASWTGSETFQWGSPKLDPDQAAKIRELRARGWSTGRIADFIGVSRATICNVLLGRTSYAPRPAAPLAPPVLIMPCPSPLPEPAIWTGGTALYNPAADPHAKLTHAMVDEARDLRARGWHVKDLAERCGVSGSTMSAALAGRTWRRSAPPCSAPLNSKALLVNGGEFPETQENPQKTGVLVADEIP